MVEYQSLKRQLKDVLTQADIDSKKASSLQDKIGSAKADLTKTYVGAKIDMMKILTADQRKALRLAMVKGPSGKCGDSMRCKVKKMMESSKGGH